MSLFTTGRIAMMCSGPDAQQPPMICAPISFHSWANSASRDGEYSPNCTMSGPRLGSWLVSIGLFCRGPVGLYPRFGYAPTGPSNASTSIDRPTEIASGLLHISRTASTGCPFSAPANATDVYCAGLIVNAVDNSITTYPDAEDAVL